MRLPRFELIKAETVDEALSVLQRYGADARILAGGTDLLVNMKYGVIQPKIVVSIRSVPELSAVTEDSDGTIRIGAASSLTDLAQNSLLSAKVPVLRDAVKSVASQHIRNIATFGGNICLDTRCWYYNQSKQWRVSREPCHKTGGSLCHAIKGSPRCHAINSSDNAPVLIALSARFGLQNKDRQREVSAVEFYNDNGAQHTVLSSDEMLTAVHVPAVAGDNNATFIKVSMREGIDFAMGNIAATATINGKKCSSVKLVIGSIKSVPLLLEKTAQAIIESGLSNESIENAADVARSELGTLTNLFTSAGYKRDLSRVLVKRALNELKGSLKNR